MSLSPDGLRNVKGGFAGALAVLCFAPWAGSAATIGGAYYASQYDFYEFFAATDHRDFQVVWAGDPFPGIDAATVAHDLLPVLQGAKPRPALTFTFDAPVEKPHPDYRLVLIFDPANNLSSNAVCRGETRLQPPRPNNLYVYAVYCRDEQVMSETTARTQATSLADPRVGQLFRELFQVVFSDLPALNPSAGPRPSSASAEHAGKIVKAVRETDESVEQAAERCRRDPNAGGLCSQPSYSIQAIYFNASNYPSVADCLTAAYSSRLPLELCH
jgi:hypothetical protein